MTFTKEQLQQIEATAKEVLWPIVWTPLRARKHFEEKITPEVVLALARMALAGMEAEPVAWRIHTPSVDVTYVEMNSDAVEKVRLYCAKENIAVEITPLYTAQQPLTTTERAELENYRNAQQVVPDEYPDDSESACIALERCRTRNGAFQRYKLGWDDCRAAMLQGKADGNSTVIPNGWVACSERMPEQFVEVLVCTEDGGQYVAALNQSMTWDDGDFFDDIQYVTHWIPLPAAPQQEAE